MKKIANNKVKAVLVFVQQICVLTMVLILMIVVEGMGIYSKSRQTTFYIDMMDEAETFYESDTFKQMFHGDIDYLVYSLAVCQQFEVDGKFDKNKTIDLLQYVNRKQADASRYSSKGKLEYKVGDLINWRDVERFEYFENYDGDIYNESMKEAYLPSDGESIYRKDLYQILFEAGILDENGNELTYERFLSENDEVGFSESVEVEEVQNEAQGEVLQGTEVPQAPQAPQLAEMEQAQATDLSEQNEIVSVENATETDAAKRDVFQRRAEDLVEQYIVSAANDLSSNYEVYGNMKKQFAENVAIKYIYVPNEVKEGSKQFYTNCSIKNSDVESIKSTFEQKLKNGESVYVKVDFDQDEITARNYKTEDENYTEIRRMIHQYDYSFVNKGTLYIACLYDEAELAAFGETKKGNSSECWQAEKVYQGIYPYIETMICVVVFSAVLFLISLVLFSCLIGWRKVRNEDGTEIFSKVTADDLSGFDTWYTSIAFVIAVCVELLLMGGVGLAIALSQENVISTEAAVLIAVVSTILLTSMFQIFWVSFLRRWKAKTLWTNGILYCGYRKIKQSKDHLVEKINNMMADKNIVVRFWIPYGCFLGINMILIALFHAATDSLIPGFVFSFLFDCFIGVVLHQIAREREEIVSGIGKIADGEITYKVDVDKMHVENKILAKAVNRIGDGIHEAVQISMKDERLKADLITNVSHDIKTPLTSIINYVDLLKRENIDNEKAQEYIKILEEKSQRLKQLTLDLVEASKISSGNIVLNMEEIKIKDLMLQVIGEFSDKFEEKNLEFINSFTDKKAVILADSRRMWRVMENLFNNIYKYAMPGTRVYLDVLEDDDSKVTIVLRNISAQPLNIPAEELTERFIRGDISRSTEGSGLGLSIAKNLVEAQGGTFEIVLDGDLFKIVMVYEGCDV